MKKTLTVLTAAAFIGIQAGAAVISWGAPTWIAGDSDVSTDGTAFAAINPAGATEVINGVTFLGSDANLQPSGGAGWADFIVGQPSVNLLPPTGSYSNTLETAVYSSAGLAIFNIVVGQEYQVQVWSSDAREGGGVGVGGRTMTLDNAVTLAQNQNDGTSTFGQWATGTFIADDVTQNIIVTAGDSQINLAQVRAIPEPATMGLIGLGSMMVLFARRFRR